MSIIIETNTTSLSKTPSQTKLRPGVIAIVSGPTFFPDKTSRNNVHYPREAWDKALREPKFKERLTARNMFGTIGHNDTIDDEFLRTGQFSHIVSNAYIDKDGVGICEYDILDTPTGRIVKTLLDAGVGIKVSTQIEGDIKEEKGEDGAQIIEPGTVDFFRVDFVIDPGFVETNPTVKEVYKKVNQRLKTLERNMLKKQKLGFSSVVDRKERGEDKTAPIIKDMHQKIAQLTKELEDKDNEYKNYFIFKKYYKQKYYEFINQLGALIGLDVHDTESLLDSSVNIINLYANLSQTQIIDPVNVNNYTEETKLQYLEDLVECIEKNKKLQSQSQLNEKELCNQDSKISSEKTPKNSFMFERANPSDRKSWSKGLREILD